MREAVVDTVLSTSMRKSPPVQNKFMELLDRSATFALGELCQLIALVTAVVVFCLDEGGRHKHKW